jgi:hypothetical protein
MARFDFISAPEFRHSLESDYQEMKTCFGAKAWKSAQVLAGSTVEALLIDYLLATKDPTRPVKDPLKLTLGEAVQICRTEGVLSERASDLCSVVRSYRSLIHPGRAVRLNETPPDEGSATIALALVDLIIDEVARKRRSEFGLTAEQIVSKIERDQNANAILRHLLTDVSELERERLLLDLLPARYFVLEAKKESLFDDFPSDDWPSNESGVMRRLAKSWRIVFDTVGDEVKARTARQFVKILKSDDGDRVLVYSTVFFRAFDLKHVPLGERGIIKQHLFSRLPSGHTAESVQIIEGLSPFLEPTDVRQWVDPFVRALISTANSEEERATVRTTFIRSLTFLVPHELHDAIDQRIEDWQRHSAKSDQDEDAAVLEQLKADIQADRLPF